MHRVCAADYRHVELPNGDVYEGEIEHDVRNGQGTYTWADGNRYVGEYRNDQMQGKGTYYWPDGRTYEGTFEKDLRQGTGVLRWPNGDRYEGEFVEDHITGHGVFVWANSDRYEGDFIGGERTGQGTYTWHNGERYEGNVSGRSAAGYRQILLAGRPPLRGHFRRRQRRAAPARSNGPTGTATSVRSPTTQERGSASSTGATEPSTKVTLRTTRWTASASKEPPTAQAEFQQWREGSLVLAQPLIAVKSCRFTIDGREWMFQATTCINGLAHGRGPAASLDGAFYVPAAHIVLGHLVEGDIRPLRSNG